MIDFKFFSKPKDDESFWDDEDMASWVWATSDYLGRHHYEFMTETHNGIHSFLRQFPYLSIVQIITIHGPNGRVHNDVTDYPDGWGFDITRDPIIIQWARIICERNERI